MTVATTLLRMTSMDELRNRLPVNLWLSNIQPVEISGAFRTYRAATSMTVASTESQAAHESPD